MRISCAALLVVLLLCGQAGAQSASQASQTAIVASALDQYIVPAYRNLDRVTDSLAGSVAEVCAAPDDANRRSLATAFAGALHAWAEVDFLRIGPMMEDGRYERFAFFPDVHGTGVRQLRRFLADESPALLEAGALAEQSAAVQGLPALESLLYAGSKALLEAAQAEPYRCALAKAVAANVAGIADEALARWTEAGGWAEVLKNPGAENPVYRTDNEAMTEILKAILTGLEQLRDHRLLPALGHTPDEAKASRAPYNTSGLALPYIAASVEALERFVDVSGILGLVPEQEKWIVGSVAFEFNNLKRALGEAGPDLEGALADPAKREKLTYAAIVLASLRDLFQNRLGPAAGLAERPAAALAGSEALFLAPARRADGNFAVLVFSERGELIREIALPARGHDLAVHPATGRAVAFARRPGTFAIAFDILGRTEPQLFLAEPERHFFGHGAYSADGKLLFATENDFSQAAGMIGVYDATDGYRRIGEFPTRGIGTHEAILLPGGKMLAIANGGIETHPDYGREMLNLPTMEPSLAFVDLDGHLVAQYRLPPDLHHLSIRHMAVGSDGKIWFGTQWEGDPLATPSLVGRASLDGGLELVPTPAPELNAMRRYVGAMAASRDGSVISASAPRGGTIVYFSAESGRYLGSTAIADSSGVAGFGAKSFLASNGEGRIIEADAEEGLRDLASAPGIAFDNHLRVVL